MPAEVVVVGTVSQKTRADVIGVVKALEESVNDHDPVALSGLYAEASSWSTVMGKRLDSREAILEFAVPTMRGALNAYARYDVVKLLEIRPDVIAVNVVQTPTDSAGTPVEGARGATLYIIAEERDGWKIVAGQNTFLDGTPS
jgi:uncharacterized protein (TIGR02246 family)